MNNRFKYYGKRGFTLIEFLFVAFTLALFLTALFNITQGGLRAYQRGVVQTEIKHELRNIMDRITTDLRQAVPAADAFTQPARTYHLHGTWQFGADFRRYQYVADNSIPDASIRVRYQGHTDNFRIIDRSDGNGYYVANFTRTETIGGTDTTSILSENVSLVYLDNVNSMSVFDGGFRWAEDPLSSNTNIDVMEVKMTVVKTHAGATEPEAVSSTSRVALRGTKDLVAGSNYYPPTTADDPYANIQRFGSPTSLIRP